MILVTGITGHSGRHFLQQLIDHKYEGRIRCIVRRNSDTSLLDSCVLNVEKIVGDLGDQEFMDEVMIGVDTVLHIASIFYSVSIMKSAIKNNVKKVILVHTTGIYSKYKSASEEYKSIENKIGEILKERNTPTNLIYLRPTMIYGNVHDKNMIVFIKMVDKLRFFPVIAQGKNLLQPVNGKDLGRAYYQLLVKTDIINGDYILSGHKPVTMIEMFKLISKILGKKTTFISFPLGLGVFIARCVKSCTLGKLDYIEKVQRMGENRSFSHEEARKDFGYSPMPLEEGLRLEIEQYNREIRSNI